MSIDKIFWLNVGKNGTFGKTHRLSTSANDIDRMFEYIKQSGKKRIAIYAHGGLNSERSGYKAAKVWHEQLKDSETHPLGIVWETGFFDSVITETKGDVLDKVKLICKELSKQSSVNSVKNKSLKSFIKSIKFIKALRKSINTYNKSIRLNNKFSKLTAARVAKILMNVSKRYKNKTNHEFLATFEEELFKETGISKIIKHSWDGMKRKVFNMFKDDENKYAGSYLLKKLAKYKKENPDFKIDLIGHSAGSILHNYLLITAKARYPKLKFNNITYLAPACTIELFYDGTINQKNNINKIRILTMTDRLERKDQTGFIYRSSLLYLISGILENETDESILGMQRHLVKKLPHHSPIDKKVQKFIKNSTTSKFEIFYSKCNETKATAHGDFFPEDKITMDTLVNISIS